MARAPTETIEKAYELYKSGLKLVEIASQLNIPDGTVRRWKSINKWDSERSEGNNVRSVKNVQPKKKKITKKPIAKEVKDVLENTDLNDKQRLFCLNYIKCFNATKAYQKAYGVDYNTAASCSYRMLDNVGIRDEITRLKQDKMNRMFLEPSDIFQKYMDIAYSDITDYLTFGREEVGVMGPFGPIEIKDEDTGVKTNLTKIVNIVKFRESTDIDGSLIREVKQGKDGASIKLQDQMKALDWLTAHIGMATGEQMARINMIKAQTNKLTGDNQEIEDMSEAEGDIYGSD